jgi:DNA polymerase IV
VHVAGESADERLVNLDFAVELVEAAGLHREADSVEYEPGGLLSDAERGAAPRARSCRVRTYVRAWSMPDEPGILHADLDAFYASVEQRDDSRLRGRPVIVGGGVVLAASYEARACGVRTAMNGRQALALCPGATVVAPRMDAYSEASRAVFAVFDDTTPLVEPLSIDEAFLDVRGLRQIAGCPADIAARLRVQVRERVGLPITVGVARTKFLAKVASGVGKPDGLLVVPTAGELAFLHPLPVQRLWGVGQVTADKLRQRGIRTVGEVAELDERALVSMLGPASGRHLRALAHNLDPRPVVVGRRRRSIGSQSALGRRRMTPAELDERLIGLVDRVARRLRSANRLCRTVVLRLRFDDFTRVTRSHTLPAPTADTAAVLAALRLLLLANAALIRARGITLIGVTLANLDNASAVQLELPFALRDTTSLDVVVDQVRDRYGAKSISRGRLLGTDPWLTVPLLPD